VAACTTAILLAKFTGVPAMTRAAQQPEAAVRLRPTKPGDLAYVLAAESDPENKEWVLAWDEAQHRESLAGGDLCHLMAEDGSGRAVGYVILAGVKNPHGSVECRRVVVGEKGRGYGRAIMQAIKWLVFEEFGAHRLWLDTQVRNVRARHVYCAVGFVEEGVLRECWYQHGAWQSLVVMSVLETEFRSEKRQASL
jgi:RimJ/RimL family protein N-acetyltransferase